MDLMSEFTHHRRMCPPHIHAHHTRVHIFTHVHITPAHPQLCIQFQRVPKPGEERLLNMKVPSSSKNLQGYEHMLPSPCLLPSCPGSGISENPSEHSGPSTEAGLWKNPCTRRAGPGQGRQDGFRELIPAVVTRVPREAGGVGKGCLGGSRRWRQRGVWGEEREAGWNAL